MRGIREPCILFFLSLCIAAVWSPAVCGMDTEKQAQEYDTDTEKTGKSAEEMTGRIPEYEICGEKLLELIEDRDSMPEWEAAEITFDTVEDAVSFGHYFYRYIYLGKQEIRLSVGMSGAGVRIYVQCDNSVLAAEQHRQAEEKLREIAAAAAAMGDLEKASFFYEWIYSHVDYDTEQKQKTVYDAVIEGRSVCWGYVSAYLNLCRMSGLICEPVYRGDHAWNRVWIEGGWKYCDITWDKGLGERRWKLVSEEEMDADPMHRELE